VAAEIDALRDALVTAIKGLDLSGIPDGNVVGLQVLEERPSKIDDTAPAVLIAPFGSESLNPITNLSTDYGYPFAVIFLASTENNQAVGFSQRMTWRSTAMDHFDSNRSSVTVTLPTGCWLQDSRIEPLSAVDPSAWFRGTFAGGFVVRFFCRKRRRAS
jgi:hypothetical protein